MAKELTDAFNAHNLYYSIASTNFAFKNNGMFAKDDILIKFAKNMTDQQCMNYLHDLRSKLIKVSYPDEEDADAIFEIKSFPMNFDKGKFQSRGKSVKNYVISIDDGITYNLKCYLMSSLVQSTLNQVEKFLGDKFKDDEVGNLECDHKLYLQNLDFRTTSVKEKFIESFKKDISDYDNVPSQIFEVRGNSVLIKDIFKNNPRLLRSLTSYYWRSIKSGEDEGSDYLTRIENNVRDFMRAKSGINISSISSVDSLSGEQYYCLIPTVVDASGKQRGLTESEVKLINSNKVFDYPVLHTIDKDVADEDQLKKLLRGNYKKGIYGMNFSKEAIGYAVLNKVIENCVINQERELFIDPECV